jgi:hypothetical protein
MNLSPEMKGWKSYVFWEGLPFLTLVFLFGFISVINWQYESKLFTRDVQGADWTDSNLGLILLATAVGQALFAALILFIVRITRPKTGGGWYMFIALILVAIFLIFPGAFIVILGPAAITMKQQMRVESK